MATGGEPVWGGPTDDSPLIVLTCPQDYPVFPAGLLHHFLSSAGSVEANGAQRMMGSVVPKTYCLKPSSVQGDIETHLSPHYCGPLTFYILYIYIYFLFLPKSERHMTPDGFSISVCVSLSF